MADVNEEIITQYLWLVKKWFCVTDIPFKVPKNYSNIDLLAYDPKGNIYYDIEVKYRSAYVLPEKDKHGNDKSHENVQWLVDQFTYYEERNIKLKEYTGRKKAQKILVTTKQMMGKKDEKRKNLELALKASMKEHKHKIDIWYFDEIIPSLADTISEKGRYNTQLLQALRMAKTYL